MLMEVQLRHPTSMELSTTFAVAYASTDGTFGMTNPYRRLTWVGGIEEQHGGVTTKTISMRGHAGLSDIRLFVVLGGRFGDAHGLRASVQKPRRLRWSMDLAVPAEDPRSSMRCCMIGNWMLSDGLMVLVGTGNYYTDLPNALRFTPWGELPSWSR
jgi:hypothetical protein